MNTYRKQLILTIHNDGLDTYTIAERLGHTPREIYELIKEHQDYGIGTCRNCQNEYFKKSFVQKYCACCRKKNTKYALQKKNGTSKRVKNVCKRCELSLTSKYAGRTQEGYCEMCIKMV